MPMTLDAGGWDYYASCRVRKRENRFQAPKGKTARTSLQVIDIRTFFWETGREGRGGSSINKKKGNLMMHEKKRRPA